MKTETKVIGAVLVLAGLGGFFFYNQRDSKAARDARSQTATKENLPSVTLNPEDIEKITRLDFKAAGKDKEGKDKESVVLEKKGDTWEVTAPFSAKAANADVKALLEALKSLKLTDTIDRGTGAYDQYEVADGKGIAFTAYAGSTKTVDVVFGSSGSRGQMMRVVGKDGVFVADGYPSTHMTKDAKGWRDKAMLKFEDANVASVKLENMHGTYSFTKNGDNWAGSFTKNPNAPAEKKEEEKKEEKKASGDKKPEEKPEEKKGADKKDADKKDADKKPEADKKDADKKDADKKPEAVDGFVNFDGKSVENMLRAFKSLNATDFGSKGDDTGLDAAATDGGIITITLKDGAGEFKLLVGKKQKGSNRFAKKDADDTVFVISSWAADWVVGEPKKFEKKDEKDAKKDPPGGGHGMPEGMDFDLEGLE